MSLNEWHLRHLVAWMMCMAEYTIEEQKRDKGMCCICSFALFLVSINEKFAEANR